MPDSNLTFRNKLLLRLWPWAIVGIVFLSIYLLPDDREWVGYALTYIFAYLLVSIPLAIISTFLKPKYAMWLNTVISLPLVLVILMFLRVLIG